MNELAFESRPDALTWPRRATRHAVQLWFILAAIGPFIFVAYIVAVFFPPIAQSGLRGLEGMHLPSGFVEGDFIGNLASVSHVLMAAIVIGGGPLQLIPAIRQRFPVFHRCLGRSYLMTCMLSAVGGLYMTWNRSQIGDVISQLGISLDAVLIIVFGALALRYAMARQFSVHRRWAMRLFMAASAVWFFRIGLMGWATLTGGIGIDWDTFTGPFLYVLGFAQYLVPLAMLEWYFHVQRSQRAAMQVAFTLTLLLLTVYMSVGIFAATMGMWLPRM
ncbi:MAG: DUF2306 domain-containing protein [Pseudomonadota bacterium]